MNDQETQAVFVALADPTRRWVIERLTRRETTTASVLADQLPITRQAISKHFKVLDEAGLVSCQQVGRERQYALSPDKLTEATDWIDTIAEQWDQRLKRLEEYLSIDGENDQRSK